MKVQGVTLLELILVLVLVSILSAVGRVKVDWHPDRELYGQAELLQSRLMFIQELAEANCRRIFIKRSGPGLNFSWQKGGFQENLPILYGNDYSLWISPLPGVDIVMDNRGISVSPKGYWEVNGGNNIAEDGVIILQREKISYKIIFKGKILEIVKGDK